MTIASRRVVPLALCAAVWLPSAAPAFAQDDVFRRGMDARGDRKWPEVATAMRTATANDPKESTRRVRGKVGFVPNPLSGDEYLPYFYLGEALLTTNDCAGALTAWEESDRQGVARSLGPNAKTIQAGYAKCEAQGFLPAPKYGDELKAARTALGNANEVLRQLAQDLAARPAIKVDAPAQTAARGQIATAGERLASGEKTRRAQDFIEARNLSDTAVRQLQALRAAVAGEIKQVEVLTANIQRAETAVQSAENAAKDVESMFSSSPFPIAPSDRLNVDRGRALQLLTTARDRLRNAAGAEGEIAEAEKAVREALTLLATVRVGFEEKTRQEVIEELERLQRNGAEGFVRVSGRVRLLRDSLNRQPNAGVSGELEKLEAAINRSRRTFDNAIKARDLREARTGAGAPTPFELQLEELATRLGINQPLVVPPALAAAAQAQFNGRYAEVLAALSAEGIDLVPIGLRLHAHLIRSAALFALYEVSWPRDESLRARARDEAVRARQLDPAFQPGAAFSPRFIRFYQAAAVALLQ